MFFVPVVVTNFLFLFTAYLLGVQQVRIVKMKMPGQSRLYLVIFCLIMMLATTFYNRVNPWLSLAFFIVAIACTVQMLRLRRYLPSRERRV